MLHSPNGTQCYNMATQILSNSKIVNYFAVQKQALLYMGLDVLSSENYIKYRFVVSLAFITMVTHEVPMFIYALQDLTDIYRVTDTFACVAQTFMSTFKLFIFIYKRNKIFKLVQKLNAENSKHLLDNVSHELLAKQNRNEGRFSKIFNIAASVSFWSSLFVPLIEAGIYYKANNGFKPRTPLSFSFWLDESDMRIYWPIWTYGGIGTFFVAYMAIAADTFYSWMVHNIVAQFHILQHRLEQAACENAHGNPTSDTLIDCIHFHGMAMDLSQQFNKIYSEIIAVKFTLSFLEICTLAYRYSRGAWGNNATFRILFLVTVFLQLASYCYGGEQIKYESEMISWKIYTAFDWPNVNLRNRKMLMMIMLRAQRVCRMSSFLFNVDLGLLLWVGKTAGSFIAMLKTLEAPT